MRRPTAFGYQNAALTAIAVLLAVGLMDRRPGGEFTSLPAAHAQSQPDQGGMTNALEQRKIMIAELRSISARLDRIESKLSAGINVKVTSMPAIKVDNPEPKAKPKAEENTAPKADAK